MIEIGTLDRVTSVIGERGTGKSTYAKIDSRAFQREVGGLVIGHSPNGQIGRDPDIQFHDSIEKLDKALRKRPDLQHYLASGGTPEDVVLYGRRLAEAIRRDAHKRAKERFSTNRPAPKGLLATPVLIVVDEGTHTNTASTASQRILEKFLTSARHEHVSFTQLIQAPTARSWTVQEQTTRFRVFRYYHEWGTNAVRAAGVPKEAMARVRDLEKFEYFHFDKDDPKGAGFRRLPDPK